jgi:hypothetical protein
MRTAWKLGLVLVFLAAMVLLAVREPILVRWHAHRLESSDPNARAASRAALLALGRPAIDGVYPDLVAQEVSEEATVASAVVIVGVCRAPFQMSDPIPHRRTYEVVEVLSGTARVGEVLEAEGPLVCPTALALWRDDARLELAVLVPAPGRFRLRLAVPLSGDDRARIGPAVRARLAGR